MMRPALLISSASSLLQALLGRNAQVQSITRCLASASTVGARQSCVESRSTPSSAVTCSSGHLLLDSNLQPNLFRLMSTQSQSPQHGIKNTQSSQKPQPGSTLNQQQGSSTGSLQKLVKRPWHKLLVNDEISATRLTVHSHGWTESRSLPLRDALRLAGEAGLDLVQVDDGLPATCILTNARRFKDEQRALGAQRAEAAKAQKKAAPKEVVLGAKIQANDLATKTKRVKEMLGKGHRVQVLAEFGDGSAASQAKAGQMVAQVVADVAEAGVPEKAPQPFKKAVMVILKPKAQSAEGAGDGAEEAGSKA